MKAMATTTTTSTVISESYFFGPIIKKTVHWTRAEQECRQHGGTVAFTNNEGELAAYQNALGLPPTFVGRIWHGRFSLKIRLKTYQTATFVLFCFVLFTVIY
ncbi:unnamed protein product [Oikopleura dioica]|uniref:C-type lectin domain-containing protein n=1 Tax=Oikopleura dioica TaxID=34765 RepID=E4XWT5_OIKDI|nr:unnamed protein product [Oikopleura dioica]